MRIRNTVCLLKHGFRSQSEPGFLAGAKIFSEIRLFKKLFIIVHFLSFFLLIKYITGANINTCFKLVS